MKRLSPKRFSLKAPSLILAATLCALASSALAQGVPRARPQDVARWSRPDVTPAQRKATALKEAHNAYAENRRECYASHEHPRGSCLTKARALYQRDLDHARRYGVLLTRAERPRATLTETRVIVETPDTAIGSSADQGTTDSGDLTPMDRDLTPMDRDVTPIFTPVDPFDYGLKYSLPQTTKPRPIDPEEIDDPWHQERP